MFYAWPNLGIEWRKNLSVGLCLFIQYEMSFGLDEFPFGAHETALLILVLMFNLPKIQTFAGK